MPPKVVTIVGPTASGKTRMAVELAQQLDGEVVSVDSMQIYRRMDIGTAKPTAEEMGGIPHHMIDVAEPWENWSVARYVQQATACVDDILARGKLPILAGGTGLWLDALVDGRTFAVQATGWRQRLQERAAAEGTLPLLEELRRVDPETAERLHQKDEKRIIRALEVYYETGKPISRHNAETKLLPKRYAAVSLGLCYADRAQMWERIDRRVDEMLERGLAQEVRNLLAEGVSADCTAMQAIGYKELTEAVQGGGDLAAAGAEVKLRSRQYAKRQLTWFRRNPDTHWITWENPLNFAAGRQVATEKLKEHGIYSGGGQASPGE
jgi:tRNA dimethylallyltransferase